MLIGTKKDEALEAMRFAFEQDDRWDGMEFLRAWYEGDGDALQEWPEWIEHINTLPEARGWLGRLWDGILERFFLP